MYSSRKNPKHFLFPDRDNSLLFSVLFGWKWKTCVFWSVIHIILQEFSPFSDRQIKQQQKIIWYSQLFFFWMDYWRPNKTACVKIYSCSLIPLYNNSPQGTDISCTNNETTRPECVRVCACLCVCVLLWQEKLNVLMFADLLPSLVRPVPVSWGNFSHTFDTSSSCPHTPCNITCVAEWRWPTLQKKKTYV